MIINTTVNYAIEIVLHALEELQKMIVLLAHQEVLALKILILV